MVNLCYVCMFHITLTMLVKDFRWNETGNTIVAGPSFSGKLISTIGS